jgi:peptide/nickel transport system permease protein
MMPFDIVILWTDALIFVLIVCLVAAGFYIRSQEHLRASWRRVVENRTGMAAITVLLVFVAVGLADSLHYRAAPQVGVWSVLDALLRDLKTHTEKTYSAPFAANLDARETVTGPDGAQMRIYPRLVYGGAHLVNPDERSGDILWRATTAGVHAVAGWIVICAIVVALLARRSRISFAQALASVLRGETATAWNAALFALGAVLLLAVPALELSSFYHVFGTDKVGNDVFYQALKGIRTALVIGTLTTLAMLPLAAILGILAGYLGGVVDDVVQYVYTTLNSIPGVLLIAAAVLLMQVFIEGHQNWFATAAERADARLLALCLILGITSWTGLCRLLRAETLKLRELEYVEAARAFGVSHWKIMLRHILPNLMHIVLISLVMDFSGLVLAEAVLSYVGIGVDQNTISFGSMINTARMELAREPIVWWSLAAAFSFMFTLVLMANLLADAVRDALDPRMASRVNRAAAAKAGR